MQKKGSELVFSPHDLVAFLQGDLTSWMDRFYLERRTGGLPADVKQVLGLDAATVKPDESDEGQELIKRKGQEHEARLLTRFRLDHADMVEFEQSAETRPTADRDLLQGMNRNRKKSHRWDSVPRYFQWMNGEDLAV